MEGEIWSGNDVWLNYREGHTDPETTRQLELYRKTYDTLPILDLDGIPAGTFYTEKKNIQSNKSSFWGSRMEALFLESLITAIRNPSWLGDSQEDNVDLHLTDVSENPYEWATDFNKSGYFNKEFEHLLIARALEIISEQYPNLVFTRGTGIDLIQGATGVDYSWGELDDAISFYHSFKFLPVVATIPFSTVARLLKENKLLLATEGDWYRRSIEFHPEDLNEWKSCLSTYRLPEALLEQPLSPQTLEQIAEKSISIPSDVLDRVL